MTDIELKNVTYTYSPGTPFQKTALDDVSLRFEGGCITGLMGHTGSGKSTLVQLLNGLLKPTSGTVLLGGCDIWAEPKKIRDVRFRVGLVFQYPEYQLFEESVGRDIAYGPKNMGLSDDELKVRVADALRFVGLDTSVIDKSPFDLSGGQRRRVAIAGVIAMEPEVLILDEPAAGLDPRGREDILGGVRSYQRERGNTVIIVSHSMEDMARYADRLVVMNQSKLYMDGTTAEVFRRSDDLTAAGLDIPQITRLMNVLRARGVELADDIYTVERARDVLAAMIREKRAHAGAKKTGSAGDKVEGESRC